jgi:asparagine synthase (glutamine-hydrolysing)
VQKLRGMFALAIYDKTKRKLVLARDRLGKKPLHYALLKDKLYFASEIKSILAVAPELAEINAGAARIPVLRLRARSHHGVHRNPKAAAGTLAGIRERQDSDSPVLGSAAYNTHVPKQRRRVSGRTGASPAGSDSHPFDLGRAARSVSQRRHDSSTVVALMARASSGPVKTFSIGFTKDDFNEAQYARMVARKFGTDHHEMILEPNVVETVEHLTSSLEEPFGDSSMLPTYYVSQMARQHVTVALSGDGGDELFAGYDRYRIHSNRRFFEYIPEWARRFYRDRLFRLHRVR